MEVLATFGLAAKELFDYNRDNYKFDQVQRQDRDILRQNLQVTRFSLFREDLRDLVELTVGKMEMYHLVAALFLESSVSLYCEGRIHRETPPFLLSLYYLSVASAVTFLLLAVWLSMHASICSHSFGVRLLTRFVRLPVPGVAQMGALNAKLSDFERQGVKQMLRVPIIGGEQIWAERQPVPIEEVTGPGIPSPSAVASPGAPDTKQDLLGSGMKALNHEDKFLGSARKVEKHIELFRKLQAKWQCYDAYSRVCMALGANQMLLSLAFFVTIVTVLEYKSPTVCFALLFAFNSGSMALAFLDISNLGTSKILLLQAIGNAPSWIAALSVVLADKKEDYIPVETNKYPAAPVCFFLSVLWFEGLLRVAWPSKDEATLPRRFRAVLFLDVFEDVEMEGSAPEEAPETISRSLSRQTTASRFTQRKVAEEAAEEADEALWLGHCALRRWEAVPDHSGLSDEQRAVLGQLRHEVRVWHQALLGSAAIRTNRGGRNHMGKLSDEDDYERAWQDLEESEQDEDPFAGTLLGPFLDPATASVPYHFDLEAREFVWQVPEEKSVLLLTEVQELILRAEAQVRGVVDPGADDANYVGSDGATSSSEADEAYRSGKQPVCLKSKTGAAWRDAIETTSAVQRLPWKVMCSCTRGLQLGWLIIGVASTLEEVGVLQVNVQVSPESSRVPEAQERRLLEWVWSAMFSSGLEESAAWQVRRLTVEWPQHRIFRPESVSCLLGENNILIGNGHQLYLSPPLAEIHRKLEPISWEDLPNDVFPPETVPLCATPSASSRSETPWRSRCLMSSITKDGHELLLWSPSDSNAEAIRIKGSAWRKHAGIQVPCHMLEEWLNASDVGRTSRLASNCLVLVGWDGHRLPVAVLRLGERSVTPLFDAPFALPRGVAGSAGQVDDSCPLASSSRQAKLEVLSLSLETMLQEDSSDRDTSQEGFRDVRLWSLLTDGSLQGWNLIAGKSLGRWKPKALSDLRATSICSVASKAGSEVIVAGRRETDRQGNTAPELLALTFLTDSFRS